MNTPLIAAIVSFGALGLALPVPAQDGTVIRVDLRQTAEDAPPVGVNDFGDSGGTRFSAGNLIPDASFEPISIRRYWRVIEAGNADGYPWIQVDRGGMTQWDLVTTGFLNGADYRLYRIVDDAGRPLGTRDGYLDTSRAERFVRVGEGSVPEAGARNLPLGGFVDEPGEQRIYLDGPAPRVWDYIVFEKRTVEPQVEWSHPRLDDSGHSDNIQETWRPGWGLEEAGLEISRRYHDDPPAQMSFPGESFYEVTSSVRGEAAIHGPYIFFPINDNPEGNWYSTLEPGETYRYEAWLRAEDLRNRDVQLGFFAMYDEISESFVVGSEWRRYGFEFTAPPRPTHDGWHAGPAIRFTGPGALQIDNVRLFRIDEPSQADDLFAPSPMLFDELMAMQPAEGEKGMLRAMWIMMNDASMASLLAPYRDAAIVYDWYIATQGGTMTLPGLLDYAYRTGDGPETRMKPWLNISTKASEEEWAMLMEFLAAPIDPDDRADIASKPWAYLRYLERGIATPWTEEFEKITVEFANETWHNGAVEEQWTGWHRANWVHHGGHEFGLWTQFIGSYLEEHSPWFVDARARGRVELAMGSNYEDYAEVGVPHTDFADVVGHTTYVGPRWEAEEAANIRFDEEGLQATLLGYAAGLDEEFDRYRVQREELAATGHDYRLYAYEGGPSGYTLPGTAEDSVVDIGERYGKSQAMAVASLEAWLGAYQAGFSEMGFLSFAQGQFWSSHTSIREGFRRHVPWLAVTLRNRHASGTMIDARVSGAPTIRWAGSDEPLIGAYAFRDGSRLAVFVVSRRVSGSATVRLELPAAPRGTATLYALEGAPAATNRFQVEVAITERPIRLERETDLEIPAAAIHLYVVDSTLPADSAAPPERPELPRVSAGDARGRRALVEWDAVPGAEEYVVYCGSEPHFRVEEAVEVFRTSATALTDPSARAGRAYYRVSAVNSWGEGMPSFVAAPFKR